MLFKMYNIPIDIFPNSKRPYFIFIYYNLKYSISGGFFSGHSLACSGLPICTLPLDILQWFLIFVVQAVYLSIYVLTASMTTTLLVLRSIIYCTMHELSNSLYFVFCIRVVQLTLNIFYRLCCYDTI